jgi:hypothetical protein
MKECNRCLFDESVATIGEHQCEYCDLHDQLEAQANPSDLMPLLDKVRSNKKYDCIMGISGGVDSSLLLYLAVKHWNLKPLVIHFDNHYNVPQATHNMSQLIKLLNVDAITYNVNKLEYDTLNDAFIQAGLPDADIPNDIAMTKLMYDTAYKYGIKYILNGHDFRTEGSTPKGWTYMDAKYIRSVYRWHTNKELTNYPLFTFKDQLFYALIGIKNIRPFHYIKEREALEAEMKAFISWQDYGGKHCENVYTEFVGGHLLPTKFGIDKRIVYLSAQVRSGKLTKEEAKEIFNVPHVWDNEKLNIEIPDTKMERNEFERYDFKKYRLLMWVLAKMKVVPYTFYIKYCK